MCAKLKCCLNYEADDYVESSRKIPSREIILQTVDGDYYFFKADILAGLVTYSTDKNLAANLETITTHRAKEIIEMNKRGEKPASLLSDGRQKEKARPVDLLAEADISRFDQTKKRKRRRQQGSEQEATRGASQNRNRRKPTDKEGRPTERRRSEETKNQ